MKYFSLFLLLITVSFSQAQELTGVESVAYDAAQNRFLVSNSDNIISRTSDGTLEYFGTGAASYGMEVMGNTLFAINGAFVKGYDLTTEEEVMSIVIPEGSFLNGMANDGVENLFVTVFGVKKIVKINVADFDNPTYEVLVENTGTSPNGIVYDGDHNRLIFVNWGNDAKIKEVDLTDNSVSILTTTPYDNIDGIDDDNDGNYYISYWSSGTRISKYDPNFEEAPVTITTTGLSSPADICYAKEIDTLAIPHSGNQLAFIGFGEVVDSQVEILDESFQLSVSPNPVQETSRISFYLETATEVQLSIYDQQGRLLHTLMDGKQVNGQHHVMLKGLDLPQGISYAQLKIGDRVKVVKLF